MAGCPRDSRRDPSASSGQVVGVTLGGRKCWMLVAARWGGFFVGWGLCCWCGGGGWPPVWGAFFFSWPGLHARGRKAGGGGDEERRAGRGRSVGGRPGAERG